MTPEQYVQNKAAASGSSFYYAFLFLPPERRRAITALYAYCREVDDVVDECTDPSLARVKLAWWRTQVDQMYDGKPDHPVTRALQPHLESCAITRERLLAVIDGMEMDLDQTRYLDWPGLRKYCWHAAGVVGELSAGVFGQEKARCVAGSPIGRKSYGPASPTQPASSRGWCCTRASQRSSRASIAALYAPALWPITNTRRVLAPRRPACANAQLVAAAQSCRIAVHCTSGLRR